MTSQLLWTNAHLLFQTFNHQWDGKTIYLSGTSYPTAANAKSKPRKHAMALERQSFQDERERRCMCLVYQVNLTKESDDDTVSSLEDQGKRHSLGRQRKTRRSRLLKVAFLFWKGREELLIRHQLRVHHEKPRTEFLWFEKGQHKKVK
ncbi:hypothetical protein IGI04_034463 [Brassica rapa subsp. trilocularis]|uniref:Uncharacterized protein n=2 Tax=Brassica campestris TaxID=3711 RepID=A0A3P5XXI2_BRACM|nr:hypothetical protein IGI04_034463 [Brassica rapa subsp. trilocularis]CAG7861361.1 unnamed protein product [Brassica rapa]VDC59717.1 unnamed protein product [Brassica rapa]